MAPPRPNQPDPWEQEYAIRSNTTLCANHTSQIEKLENTVREVREEVLVMKTKIIVVSGGFGILGGFALAAVKMLIH